MKLGFVLTVVAAATALAMAEPRPVAGGWPDAHSGSYLGVHIDEVNSQMASALKLPDVSGALITYVDQDGPACKAGLKNNDVVVGFNGSKVQNPDQLQEMIHATAAGKTVNLTIVREGQKKDVSVTLGAWPNAMHARNLPPTAALAFAPPAIKVPDIDVPSFTTLSSRHGVVVESMCPQLADYFGVPRGQGVLVRSVEKGSPAEAAGLKAGDVIVKVNNETVHDMADWRHAMHAHTGRIPMSVVRDKHEQNLVFNLPASGDTSEFRERDWLEFGGQMEALQQQMEDWEPELEREQAGMMAQAKPSEQEMQQMRENIERAMKLSQKDFEKMQKDLQKSLPSQKELEKMQKDFEKMRQDLVISLPSQQQLDQISRQVEESMKNWTPQFQQQMEQLKKQMEQQKLDMQELLKGFNTDREF